MAEPDVRPPGAASPSGKWKAFYSAEFLVRSFWDWYYADCQLAFCVSTQYCACIQPTVFKGPSVRTSDVPMLRSWQTTCTVQLNNNCTNFNHHRLCLSSYRMAGCQKSWVWERASENDGVLEWCWYSFSSAMSLLTWDSPPASAFTAPSQLHVLSNSLSIGSGFCLLHTGTGSSEFLTICRRKHA